MEEKAKCVRRALDKIRHDIVTVINKHTKTQPTEKDILCKAQTTLSHSYLSNIDHERSLGVACQHRLCDLRVEVAGIGRSHLAASSVDRRGHVLHDHVHEARRVA